MVGILAAGFGATITVFAVAEAVLYRDLPAESPERLVYMASQRLEGVGLFSIRLHEAIEWRDSMEAFESLAVLRRSTAHLRVGAEAERLRSAAVTPSYFEVLGRRPILGRGFAETEPGDEPVVLLAHDLWLRHFAGDEEALGATLELDGAPHTIIGVMPPAPESRLLGWQDVWTRLELDPSEALEKEVWGFSVLARLADGTSLDAARRELDRVSARLAEERPSWNGGWRAEMRPVREWMARDVKTALRLLIAAAILVLGVALLTASNLLYALTAGRRSEMATRRALGAGEVRLLAQLFAESAVLATLAAGLGLSIAVVVGKLAVARLPSDLLGLERLGFGPRTWISVVLATFLASFVCSALAALAVRPRPGFEIGHPAPHEGRRLRAGLVTVETALAFVAIAGSLSLLANLRNLQTAAPGFQPGGLATLRFELLPETLPEKATRIATLRQLRAEVEALPGVRSAALAGFRMPLTGDSDVFQVWVEGRPRPPEPDVMAHAQVVSEAFFETLGVELVEGRVFAPGETWESHHGMIVNRAFVDSYFADRQAL
ncbi:MAG: ABC transporter permease, partial [Holophagales bacterium]|nr:ABC transporter permease [Holophagales bacterium]